MKRTTLVAGSLALAGLLAGCGTGTLGNAGVAARVGGDVISLDTFTDRVDRGLANAAFKEQVGERQAEYQRSVLQTLIRATLVERLAADHGVTVTAAEYAKRLKEFEDQAGGRDKLVEQAEQNGVSAEDIDSVIREFVLNDAVADKLVENEQVAEADLRKAYQTNITRYDQVHVRHILVEKKATADSIMSQLRGGGDFAALAKQHSTDTSNKDNGGDLGFTGKGAFVPEFEKAIFAVKNPPQLVGPVKTQFGYHVIEVLERKTTTFEQARADLRREALQDKREAVLETSLKTLVKKLVVSVSPRIGAWDAEAVAVVAPKDELSTPTPTPADSVPPQDGLPPDGQQPAPQST